MPKLHDTPLIAGKLPATLLAELLSNLPTRHPQLLLGPAVGEDAAVIDLGSGSERLLVAKSDPITFATDEIGYYAVNVCANDIAVTGAAPRFYLPTLLLPAGHSDEALVRRIFAQIGAACAMLDIVVAGGHTEITPSVNQAVIAGTMLGEVARDRYISGRGCRMGDVVLLAGQIPIEGASIIAREKRADLLARGWPAAQIDEAAAYLHNPGISVMVPAQVAANTGLVTSMHDPTEGGIATGLYEMAVAAGADLKVNLDAIPVAPVAAKLCATYGLDPLGTIASGALLATCAPEDADKVIQAWAAVGWSGTVIGQITKQATTHTSEISPMLVATRAGHRVSFPTFAADEIIKLWT